MTLKKIKHVQINIPRFRSTLFYLQIFGEIVIPFNLLNTSQLGCFKIGFLLRNYHFLLG